MEIINASGIGPLINVATAGMITGIGVFIMSDPSFTHLTWLLLRGMVWCLFS